jgi:hypothetical protein
MDEGDCHRAFAYGRGNSLHGAVAHVASGEDAGKAGFQKIRLTLRRTGTGNACSDAGPDETVGIGFKAPL